MERLGDCLELMHSSWLASSISWCFPQRQRLQDQPAPGSKDSAAPGTALGNATYVCHEQPRSYTPPLYQSSTQHSHTRQANSQSILPRPLTSHRVSSWDDASRPVNVINFKTRKSSARRPTIGAPTDFRKVQSGRISPIRKASPFRPLQLSIYIPGNELPALPVFWEGGATSEEEDTSGVKRPVPALLKSKSDPMLLRRPSSTFSIPRKPIISRTSSITLDASRFSVESNLTFNALSALNDFPKPPQSRSIDQPRSAFPERRSSIATTRSAQDFLNSLDSRIPQPPPAVLRSKTEPTSAIYRKASEQSLRLRTHLEERECLEKRLPDLTEEVSPLSTEKKLPPSPVPKHDFTFESGDLSEKTLPTLCPPTHRPQSSSGSSTLLNPSTLNLDPFHPDLAVRKVGSNNSLRNRFSQWLLKALPSLPPIELDRPPQQRSSRLLSVSAQTIHTKQSSTSTYWRGSMDMEKFAAPMFTPVGVAL